MRCWIVFIILIILREKAIANSELLADCGITTGNNADLQTTYIFEEVKEDHEVNKLIASYQVINVKSASLVNSNNSFVNLIYNKVEERIEFYLMRNLKEYRQEKWKPSMEIEFNLNCESETTTNLTKMSNFLLIVKDENIYTPKFDTLEYNFNLTVPMQSALHSDENPVAVIIVTDFDYNPINADVSFTCDGQDCCYFQINYELVSNTSGYKYEVKVFLNETSGFNNIKKDTNLLITIEASDKLHLNRTQLNFPTTKVLTPEGQGSKLPIGAIAGGGGAVAGLCLLFAIGLIYTTRNSRKAKNILRKLTEAEIREFLDGAAGFSAAVPKRSVDCNTPILDKPYNKNFEIARDKLRIDETTVLGKGFFGIVMKGSIIHQNGECETVAVKAVKRNVGVLYFKALLSELKIMSFIGKHNNIVSLMGACTHNIRKREVFIAVEYCANGNLHNYLRAYRAGFIDLVQDGKLCGFSINNYSKEGYSKQMSTLDLVKWSTQIASGMEYLSSLKVIHGDLATRNILLDSVNVAKIADFGLSRRLIDVSNYYYTKQSQVPLPWKWMAPESLKDMKFSTKSDIWSFGVVLFEIFSLGQTPYPGLNWDETFVGKLEKGLRLTQPAYASNSIYEIMLDCWTDDPSDRPAIFDIKRMLELMTSSLLFQRSDEEYFKVLGAEKYIYIGEGEKDDTNLIKYSYKENDKNVDC